MDSRTNDNNGTPVEFMGAELSPEEWQAQRSNDLRKNAQQAQDLLNNPMVKDFLETERAKTIRAFKLLPMESPHQKYMALKIYFNCLDNFEKRLTEHVTKWSDDQVRQERNV